MALDYKTGPGVMMQLGSFQFGITTAAYQELKRTTEWRWPAQDQFGKLAALQYVGPGNDTITLPGVIYTEWRGGLTQLETLRALGDTGEPQTMIDGSGSIVGKFVIERVDEGQTVFADAGKPRKQEFTVQLRRIHDDSPATVVPIVPAVTPAAVTESPAIPATATTPVAKITGLADSVASSVSNLKASISAAYTKVMADVAPITSLANSTAGAVMRCADVANDMLFAVNRVRAVVGLRPTNLVAIAEAKALASKANILMTGANSASVLLRRTTAKIEGLAGSTASAVAACRNAANTAEKLAALCRKTATEATKVES